jgi:dihydrodipicolinate synthase/N-acetylneuraminate lyase
MTHNEMSPDLFVGLAGRYPHVILLKDTSGKDRVALQDKGESGVFLVRGAEGDYVKWLREGGGPYDGLLLSTANCFPAELRRMIVELQEGKIDAARAVSARLSQAVYEVFELVAGVPHGNPFTNANKAMDHFMAYGSDAEGRDPPRLHAGTRLPVDLIRKVGTVLREADLIPARGYLENG